MNAKTMMAALALATTIGGCSKQKAAAPDAPTNSEAAKAEAAIARSHVKVTPAVPDEVKGPERQEMQEQMIEQMADSPEISPGEYDGEAYRRGVKPTPAQIARKKASYKAPKEAPQR